LKSKFPRAAFFLVSLRKKSLVVSGSKIAQALANVSSTILAGATTGFPFGVWILILGVINFAINTTLMQRKIKQPEESQARKKDPLLATKDILGYLS
jgi:mannose/fructose/N-acetylgalactosamine-specific phosphotransferase system component IIC